MGNKELLKRRRNDIDKMKISPELDMQLKEIFHRCDIDGNGTVELDEVRHRFVKYP